MLDILTLVLFIGVIWLLYKIVFCLFSGVALMWPLINIFGYLKVLLFPRSVRKIYGSSLAALSKNSFDQEITGYDKKEIAKLFSRKNELHPKLQSLKKDLGALQGLKKNIDGAISKRSNAGKQWYSITDNIESVQSELSQLKRRGRYLEKKPYDAWNNWSNRYARYLGNRDSIIFMIVVFPVFFITLLNINFIESYYPYAPQLKVPILLQNYEVKFKNIMEIYIYIAFVGPVLSVYNDISLFQEGVFSSLISYDYAVHLKLNYDKVFTFPNWVLVTLTMPILTLLCFWTRWSVHKKETIIIEPDDWKTNKFD
jgi:hypothetical protein